jgi:hypothetical protein
MEDSIVMLSGIFYNKPGILVDKGERYFAYLIKNIHENNG